MVIKASSAKEIDALVAALGSGDVVARETAVARLRVIGTRATGRVLAVAAERAAPVSARTAAFRVLEGLAGAQALDVALDAIGEPDMELAAAAVAVARAFLRGARGGDAVDRLTDVALDTARPEPVRLAAIDALLELERSSLTPLLKALTLDPSDRIRTAIAEASGRRLGKVRGAREPEAGAILLSAAETLPEDPDVLRHAVAQAAVGLPLAALHRLIERIREREEAEDPGRRAPWTAARAAAHAALAARGSRIALYDLRETLEGATGPVPVEFLAALTRVGDTTCLEPLAAAYARAAEGSPAPDAWWRRHLAEVFEAIVARERVTRRHAAMKKIAKRWPGILQPSARPAQ